MDRLPEFIANHPVLSALFLALGVALLFVQLRRGGQGLSPALVGQAVNRDNAVLLDIRAEGDFRAGHIPGSINIPQASLAQRLSELEKYRGRPLVVVCNMGHTAGDAAVQLKKAGHEPVYKLTGGLTAWRGENLPVVRA
jgi:rhodanese-related sulfurtransferase